MTNQSTEYDRPKSDIDLIDAKANMINAVFPVIVQILAERKKR